MTAVSNRKRKRFNGLNILRYPYTMFVDGTDYLQIDMMDYVPIGRSAPGEGGRVRYVTKPSEGFRRNTNKEPLGTVLLPIPGAIQDRNAVNYSDDSMNSLVGAGTGAIENLMKDGGSIVSNFISGKSTEEGLKTLTGNLQKALGDTGLTADDVLNLFTKSLTGRALGIFGGNVTLQSLVARSEGQIFNPNMELLFNSPSLRNFTFSFKMTPRSADESDEVKSIIRFFKRGMAPKANGNGLFLRTPNVFELRYRQGNEEHKFLHRFKQCFLTNISVNYTGDGVYSTYNDGTPVSMVMTLMFKELAPIYDIDYDEQFTSEFGGDYIAPPGGVGY